jgi:hypothetical protein
MTPELLGGLLSKEMDSLASATNNFAEEHKNLQAKIQEQVFGSLAEHQNRKNQPKLPPEIQEIVNLLLAQPRLTPAVQVFLREKVAAINASLDQILGVLPPSP